MLFVNGNAEQIPRHETREIHAILAGLGHNLDHAGRRLIGQCCFEHRFDDPPRQRAVGIEAQHVLGAAFAVDGHLNEFAFFTVEDHPVAIEDVDMHIGCFEPFTDRGSEGRNRNRVILHIQTFIDTEAAPGPTAPTLVIVADLFGQPEPVCLIQEHPE